MKRKQREAVGLADRRKAAGLTQVQVAKALDVSQPAVAAWESGAKRVPKGRREALKALTGWEPQA